MGRRLSLPERNVAAETRAVEAGHRAFVQPDGSIRVLSDTHGDLGKGYRVEFVAGAYDGLVRFTCTPEGAMAYRDDHLHVETVRPGEVPCMHAALAARRLEREGLIRYDKNGRWQLVSFRPHTHVFVNGRCTVEISDGRACNEPADPFDGLPSS